MPRYERDHDSLEETLKETHETVGRLQTLLNDLTARIDELKSETGPRQQKGAP